MRDCWTWLWKIAKTVCDRMVETDRNAWNQEWTSSCWGNEGHKLLKKGDEMKAGSSMKNYTSIKFLQLRDKEKNLTSNGESNHEPSVFAIWRFIIELQKIRNNFCTCLTFRNRPASTLVYIRKTQDKRIFTSRKAMMLGISERYCGRNCDCSEGFLHEIKIDF